MLKNNCQCGLCRSVWGADAREQRPAKAIEVDVRSKEGGRDGKNAKG